MKKILLLLTACATLINTGLYAKSMPAGIKLENFDPKQYIFLDGNKENRDAARKLGFQVPPESTPTPHAQDYQWEGYMAQVLACTLINASTYVLAKERDSANPLTLLIGFYLAKTAQHIISEDVYGFSKADWASADNNWANFWSWVGVVI